MSDQKYRCAVCLKKFLARIRPPIRWRDKVKTPELRPGESIHICGSQLMREGPFVCGDECLAKAQAQIDGMMKGVEEDLAVLREGE